MNAQLTGRVVAPLLLLVSAAPVWGQAGQVRVTGTVTSSVDGSPLPGARVVVKGTSIATLTGANGRYALDAPTPNDTLTFAFIGYRPMDVPIAGRALVNVAMEAAAIMMEEVVVTGYGTQQRRDVTGAVAKLEAQDIPPLATASVDQLLQGRIAGVQVSPLSGRPGDSSVVRIRGVGTLNNASPLYVVDGMLLDNISFLSPNDIASVEVLKDASATAIYGSRGANGVIIISSKRGTLDRPTRFLVSTYAGAQTVLNRLDLVSPREYARLANEQADNLGQTPPFPDTNAVGAGTDWQDAIFEAAPIQSYQLSASGGTDRITYHFSGNYMRQAGVLPQSDFNRLTFRVNNDYRLTERVQVGHNLTFAYRDGERPPGVLSQIYQADPTITPRNPDGSFSDASVHGSSAGNPAATLFYTRNEEAGGRVVGNLFAELNLRDRFTLHSSFGLDYGRTEYRSFTPVYFVSTRQRNSTSSVSVETATTSSWLWENTLTYNYASDRHRLSAVTGITAQSYYNEDLDCGRSNIVGEDRSFWYCNAGDAVGQTNADSAHDWKMLSYLFRANYTFRDRYLFTASWRIDGSSRFPEQHRFGHFPSFAVGWNLTEEPFMRDRKPFSALKVRASWGRIGNDKIGAYPGIPIVTGNLNAVFGPGQMLAFGQIPIALANPDVKWEQTTQTNIGADMALFAGQLEATLDYYRRLTSDILVQVPLAAYIGVTTFPYVNAAEVLNTGLEGTFSWRGRFGDLGYELGLNGATTNNEVQKLAEGREFITGGALGNEVSVTTRTVPGRPIGCFWGYKVAGVFQTDAEVASAPFQATGLKAGDLRYANLAAPNDSINELDKTFLGCPIPDVVYGFNGRLNWRNLDLSFSFSGQAGNKIFNGKKAVRFGTENFETSFIKRWNGPGTSNSEPRVTISGNNYVASDRFIEDGSFLKLQSLQVGYRLPSSFTNRLRVEQARIYVSGTNLLMITGYTGYTPELTAASVIDSGIDQFAGVFPPARTITVGLDVTF